MSGRTQNDLRVAPAGLRSPLRFAWIALLVIAAASVAGLVAIVSDRGSAKPVTANLRASGQRLASRIACERSGLGFCADTIKPSLTALRDGWLLSWYGRDAGERAAAIHLELLDHGGRPLATRRLALNVTPTATALPDGGALLLWRAVSRSGSVDAGEGRSDLVALRVDRQLRAVADPHTVSGAQTVSHNIDDPGAQIMGVYRHGEAIIVLESWVNTWVDHGEFPNAPEVRISVLDVNGVMRTLVHMPTGRAESFLAPAAALARRPDGYDLYVVRHGDSTTAVHPDRLELVRLDRNFRPRGAAQTILRADPNGQFFGLTAIPTTGGSVALLENAPPDVSIGARKQLVVISENRGRVTPRPLSPLLAPVLQTQDFDAQVELGRLAGQIVAAYNDGLVGRVIALDDSGAPRAKAAILFRIQREPYFQTPLATAVAAKSLGVAWAQATEPHGRSFEGDLLWRTISTR